MHASNSVRRSDAHVAKQISNVLTCARVLTKKMFETTSRNWRQYLMRATMTMIIVMTRSRRTC